MPPLRGFYVSMYAWKNLLPQQDWKCFTGLPNPVGVAFFCVLRNQFTFLKPQPNRKGLEALPSNPVGVAWFYHRPEHILLNPVGVAYFCWLKTDILQVILLVKSCHPYGVYRIFLAYFLESCHPYGVFMYRCMPERIFYFNRIENASLDFLTP
jgi:hypothetical protein